MNDRRLIPLDSEHIEFRCTPQAVHQEARNVLGHGPNTVECLLEKDLAVVTPDGRTTDLASFAYHNVSGPQFASASIIGFERHRG